MTTSGSTDFSVSTADIVRDALLLLRAIDPNESVPVQELADGKRALNMLAKFLQTQVSLWPTKDITVTLTPGTESYTVGDGQDIDTTRFLKLRSARRENSDGTEVEIDVVARTEYMRLPTKDSEAPVNIVYYDPQLSPARLYVWPTGNSDNTTLIITVQRPLEDFDASSNTPDFPQEWYLCLVYQLAVTLGPMYVRQVPQHIQIQAGQLLQQLKTWDTEPNTIRISPNIRRYYNRGRKY